jgi:large subunit ribosomal protein L30e
LRRLADQQLLGRVLKEAMKAGKYTLGTKEALSEVKSAKVIIAAKSVRGSVGEALAREAEKNKVPIVNVEKTSAQLGRMLGRPFRVSTIAIRSISEADLKQLQA